MTKDEIIKLSDKELRIKAAELLGWKDIYEAKICYPWLFGLPPPDGHRRVENLAGSQDEVPDYPNDIAVAMDLALSIGDRYWMELHTPFRVGNPFSAGFTPLGTAGWNGRPDNRCEADRPARAITRAFILTMEGES